MSWPTLSIVRMRGNVSNQVFQRRLSRITLTFQQEIHMSKRLRDVNRFYVETWSVPWPRQLKVVDKRERNFGSIWYQHLIWKFRKNKIKNKGRKKFTRPPPPEWQLVCSGLCYHHHRYHYFGLTHLLLIEDLLLFCGLLTFIVWNGLEILTAMNLVRVAQLWFRRP